MKQEIISKKIAIFGFGLEGKSTHKYLTKIGAGDIVVFDEKIKSDKDINIETGNFENHNYSDIEVAFRSPGIKPERLKQILPKQTKITSQVNYFMENAKGKKVLITGTKGKSTTSKIVYQLYKELNKKIFVGGNIGDPLFDFIEDLDEDSITVIELSSFQLLDFIGGGDDCIVLPIKQDHLDYHKDTKEYYSAKSNILNNLSKDGVAIIPDSSVINSDHDNTVYYSESSQVKEGCAMSGSDLRCSLGSRDGKYRDLWDLSRKYKTPLINLIAIHTYIFAKNIEIDMSEVLSKFDKPSYRFEKVSTKKNLKFYNDSAATNPISTIEAIKMMDDNFCLILGGSSKSLDYTDLAKMLKDSEKLMRIYLFGETALEIKKSLEEQGFEKDVLYKNNLEEVIDDIAHNQGGFDNVLFSPASASFDQFKNYKERGKYFNELVSKI